MGLNPSKINKSFFLLRENVQQIKDDANISLNEDTVLIN